MREVERTIRRFLGGEDGAFNELVGEWERKVFNLAWRVLGNREDAQDVVQETFLSVFLSLRNLREPGKFAAWLYRICLNHCRAKWRNRPQELSMDDPHFSGGVSSGSPDDLRLSFLLGRETRDRLETSDLIKKALGGISQEHRAAIVLKEYLGLSLEEVAEVMECPLSTAKSRVYHGLRSVQRILKTLL